MDKSNLCVEMNLWWALSAHGSSQIWTFSTKDSCSYHTSILKTMGIIMFLKRKMKPLGCLLVYRRAKATVVLNCQ